MCNAWKMPTSLVRASKPPVPLNQHLILEVPHHQPGPLSREQVLKAAESPLAVHSWCPKTMDINFICIENWSLKFTKSWHCSKPFLLSLLFRLMKSKNTTLFIDSCGNMCESLSLPSLEIMTYSWHFRKLILWFYDIKKKRQPVTCVEKV